MVALVPRSLAALRPPRLLAFELRRWVDAARTAHSGHHGGDGNSLGLNRGREAAALERGAPDVASAPSGATLIPPPGANRPHERRRGMLKLRHAQSSWRASLAIAAMAALFVVGAAQAQQSPPPTKLPLPKVDPPAKRIITQGPGTMLAQDLIPCANPRPGMNLRKNPVGEIAAQDGTTLTVPVANNFATAPKLPDLYNECAGVTPKDMSEVDLNKVPIVELDNDGEVITGFMVADNYFELYINGQLIGVDATPYTPFNSHVVRFRVKRPYTIAVLAQDWEDKLGLGMEVFQGNTWHSGDGGFVAKLSDGTVTDSTWKAQSFYIAPLQHPDDVIEYGNIHDTSHLGGRIHSLAKLPTCREHCFAIHYPIPDGWMNPNFDDSKWPQAFEYLDQEVGIMGVPGYWPSPEPFIGSRWIWTINLVFDNTVLLRKTVR